LKQALEEEFPRRRLILVLGIMGDKEILKMVPNLVPLADLLILTRPRMERAASLNSFGMFPLGKTSLEIADVGDALESDGRGGKKTWWWSPVPSIP
jgi:folylpolyglutamate synthase/dihydropteroate synthase